MVQRIAGLEHDLACGVEHREATAAAVKIAFVGSDEQLVADPGHAVRFARDRGQGLGLRDQRGLFLGCVDLVEVHRAGAEIIDDAAVAEIDQHDVVVFLQRYNRDVVLVDVDVFRFRIGGIEVGDAHHRHRARGPLGR